MNNDTTPEGRNAVAGPLQRPVGRLEPERADRRGLLKMFWPRYFDAASGEWRTVPAKAFSMDDIRDACSLCRWGRHMAIHCKPDGAPPSGPMGLHGWRP